MKWIAATVLALALVANQGRGTSLEGGSNAPSNPTGSSWIPPDPIAFRAALDLNDEDERAPTIERGRWSIGADSNFVVCAGRGILMLSRTNYLEKLSFDARVISNSSPAKVDTWDWGGTFDLSNSWRRFEVQTYPGRSHIYIIYGGDGLLHLRDVDLEGRRLPIPLTVRITNQPIATKFDGVWVGRGRRRGRPYISRRKDDIAVRFSPKFECTNCWSGLSQAIGGTGLFSQTGLDVEVVYSKRSAPFYTHTNWYSVSTNGEGLRSFWLLEPRVLRSDLFRGKLIRQ